MPKGRVLTTAEREQITRLHEGGASAREIAKRLERSKTVVLNFLKNPAQYAQIKRSGRKRALSRDDERRLYAALFGTTAHASSQPQAPSVELSHGATDIAAVAAAVAASASGVAALSHGDEHLYMPAPGHPPQDVKMSAEQIKKVFNVPLSTRRIQQLLSEWRREARREQDRQQLDDASDAPAVPLIAESHAAAASGGNASLESIAELPPLVEHSAAAPEAAVSTTSTPEAAAPVAKSEPMDSTSEPASPSIVGSSSSSAQAASASSSDEKSSSSAVEVDGIERAPVSSEDAVAAQV